MRGAERAFLCASAAAIAALAFALFRPVQAAAAPTGKRSISALPTVIVANFELVDLSPPDERYDVRSDHQRLRLISSEVRRLVAQAGRFRLLDRGRADEIPPFSFRSCRACIWDWAKKRGARFVVVGAVEKASRLILWAQISLLDVKQQSVASDASLSMRDDSDMMWKAAGKNLTSRMLSKMPARLSSDSYLSPRKQFRTSLK